MQVMGGEMSTKIEWTDATWSPITGCTQIATGCKYCYAKEMHRRLQAMGQPKYQHDWSEVHWHPEELEKPLHWRKPRMVFVNSMSDTFHEDVPDEFIASIFGIMAATSKHTYQLLTKRPERMRPWFKRIAAGNIPAFQNPLEVCRQFARGVTSDYMSTTDAWPLPNVWLGASASTQDDVNRICDVLRLAPAVVRWYSLEPLIAPIPLLPLDGISWCVVGAESGPHRRECRDEWIIDIIDQCQTAGVPVFVKQSHSYDGKIIKMPWLPKSVDGTQGRIWNQMPEP